MTSTTRNQMTKLRNAYLIVTGIKPMSFVKVVKDSDIPNLCFTQSYSTDKFQIYVIHKDVPDKCTEMWDLMNTLDNCDTTVYLVDSDAAAWRASWNPNEWKWLGYARRTRRKPTEAIEARAPVFKIRDVYTVLGGPSNIPGEMKETF